jgi:hypothetical protein
LAVPVNSVFVAGIEGTYIEVIYNRQDSFAAELAPVRIVAEGLLQRSFVRCQLETVVVLVEFVSEQVDFVRFEPVELVGLHDNNR